MTRLIRTIALTVLIGPTCLATAAPVAAPTGGPQLGETREQRLQVGMVVSAAGGHCQGIMATVPVPVDWPEQEVRILDEDVAPAVRSVQYNVITGSVKQMVVDIPYLAPGEEAKVLVTFEVVRRAIVPPSETDGYVIPARVDRELRPYLGPSPYIESRHAKIRALARDIVRPDQTAWHQVEAIYDWVREHVEYVDGPLKGAVAALDDGNGDCEELTSLFIALCRANKIPARTVWIPGHCYPEFYLEDGEGNGYWFPCEAAGSRCFGGIGTFGAILQKGDNFRDPNRPRERLRYVSEYLIGTGGRPKVRFIREELAPE